MYVFTLDRKRIILLASGLVLAAVLLFVAGLTVGLAYSGAASHSSAKSEKRSGSLPSAPAALPAASLHTSTQPQQPIRGTIASAANIEPPTATAVTPAPAAGSSKSRSLALTQQRTAAHHAAERDAWFLQAGAFSQPANARALQKRLMQAGCGAHMQNRQIGRRNWYVVEVGQYASERAARSAARRLVQRTGVKTTVRHW